MKNLFTKNLNKSTNPRTVIKFHRILPLLYKFEGIAKKLNKINQIVRNIKKFVTLSLNKNLLNTCTLFVEVNKKILNMHITIHFFIIKKLNILKYLLKVLKKRKFFMLYTLILEFQLQLKLPCYDLSYFPRGATGGVYEIESFFQKN